MDGLIERQTQRLMEAARKAAGDKEKTVEERMVNTIKALNVSPEDDHGQAMIEHLHKPQNALMQQKINRIIFRQLPPILADVVADGIRQGMFETPYPLECMEMAVLYLKTVLDDDMFGLTAEQAAQHAMAFLFHMERMLHTKPGGLAFMTKLFEGQEES